MVENSFKVAPNMASHSRRLNTFQSDIINIYKQYQYQLSYIPQKFLIIADPFLTISSSYKIAGFNLIATYRQVSLKLWKYIFRKYSRSNIMQSRYLNSQDQIIISINEQIQAMAPIRDSYTSLQRYHLKLLHDFETIVSQQDYISDAYTVKIQELLSINQELDIKKNTYVQELRALENEKAKLTLERKNMVSCCDTLSNKFNLENEQSIMLQQRSRDLMETIKRTEQNISILRKVITEIESDIRQKAAQNADTENEILRRVDFNRKTAQKLEAINSEIKAMGAKKEQTWSQIRQATNLEDQLDLKVRQELKNIKELNEKILIRKDELAQLNHQKEYYGRLIESELMIKQDLDVSEAKLASMLERRLTQCQRLEKENCQLDGRIQDHRQNLEKACNYKESLLSHLSQLAKANAILLQTMKSSCREDEKAHVILNKKLDNLDSALIRTSQSDTVPIFKRCYGLRERTNELLTGMVKKGEKSGSTWVKQLDMQNI